MKLCQFVHFNDRKPQKKNWIQDMIDDVTMERSVFYKYAICRPDGKTNKSMLITQMWF